MRNNVHQFKPRTADFSATDKILAALIYLTLGWLLRTSGSGESGFNIFLLLGVFYWIFINRQVIKTSHFFRFHYLQATLLFLFLYFAILLLTIGTGTIEAFLNLTGLSSVLTNTGTDIKTLFYLLTYYGYPALGITQAIPAILGQSPRLPFITANVMYYV